ERRLTMIYEPDSGELINPVIQVAAIGESGLVNVIVDKLEIIPLSSSASYSGDEFHSLQTAGYTQAGSDLVFEFDKNSLAENLMSEIPGGFLGRSGAMVGFTSFFGSLIPTSKDRKGLSITVQP